MPVGSLSKITVPLNNQSNANGQGLLMPKLQYRFRVGLVNFGVSNDTTELTKQVQDVTRPNLTFENMELHTYNSKVHLAGKHTWQPLTLTLRDDQSGNVTRLVGQQVQKQFDFLEQSSARSGQDYKFRMNIEMLDGGNGRDAASTLEEWDLMGAFITNVNYNTLNYAESAPVTVTMEIQYDNARQIGVDGFSGVGQGVPRTIGSNVTGVGG
jgi:hypothetical protein